MKRFNLKTKMVASVLSVVFVLAVGVIAVLAVISQNVNMTTQVSFFAEDIGAKIYVDFYHQNGATRTQLDPTGVALYTDEGGKYFELTGTSTGANMTLAVPVVELKKTVATQLNGETIYSSYVNYTLRVVNTGSRDIHFVVDNTANRNIDNLTCNYYYDIGEGRTLSRSNEFYILNSGFEELPAANTGTAETVATFTMQCYAEDTTVNIPSSQMIIPIELQATTYNGSVSSVTVFNINADDDLNLSSGQINLYSDDSTDPYASYNLLDGEAVTASETRNEKYVAKQVVSASALPRHIDIYHDIPVGATTMTAEVIMVNGTTNKGIVFNLNNVGYSVNGGAPTDVNETIDSMVANKASFADAALKTATYKKQYTLTNGYVDMSLNIDIRTIEEVASSHTLYYETNINDKSYTITGNDGVSGELVLPTYYNGLLIASINPESFVYCEGLTDVTISNSIVSIGEYAFVDCWDLTSLTIPDSVTSINRGAFMNAALTSVTISDSLIDFMGAFSALDNVSIDENNAVFYMENNCIIAYEDKSLFLGCNNSVIPNDVISIGEGAFAACYELTSVTIPNSVRSIDDYAFTGSGLLSITIPDGVQSLGRGVFSYCESLTDAIIGDGVVTLYEELFETCNSLESVTIGDGVTVIPKLMLTRCQSLTNLIIGSSVQQIGREAISSCASLSSLNIPASVISIGEYAFSDCGALTNIVVHEDNPVFYSVDNCIITRTERKLVKGCVNSIVPNNITGIETAAFYRCPGLTSITIPESVTSIGSHAFYDCTGLTGQLTIPDNVIRIEFEAFEASGYSSVVFGDGVQYIGNSAFFGCENLTSVTFGDGATQVLDLAFAECINLIDVSISNSMVEIGSNVFDNCQMLNFNTSNNIRYLGNLENPYVYAMSLVNKALTTYTFANTTKFIDNRIFRGCSALTNIVIPGSVTSILGGIFYQLTNLNSVTIENGVTTIYGNSFYGCNNLTSLTIPASVTKIYGGVFIRCSGLNNLTVSSSNPVYYSENNCIISKTDKKLIQGCKTSIIPNDVTSIEEAAFVFCIGLTDIEIPNSVTRIGKGAFNQCDNLATVSMSDNIEIIGESAFSYCYNLTFNTKNGVQYLGNLNNPYIVAMGVANYSLTTYILENTTKVIYEKAFRECMNLQNITIPNNVLYIGGFAFQYCSSLTSVTIPNSVTIIERDAFRGCTNLTSAIIGSGVTSIRFNIFLDCVSLTSVTFVDTSTWYREPYFSSFEGEFIETDVTVPTTNAYYFTSIYVDSYWFKY